MAVAALVQQPTDSQTIAAFIAGNSITYSVIPEGYEVFKDYGLAENSVVILDQNGVVSFVETAGTTYDDLVINEMLDSCTAKVASLTGNALVRFTPGDGMQTMHHEIPLAPVALNGRSIATIRKAAKQITVQRGRYGYSTRLTVRK